jgi:hypothetical protein
MDVLSSLFLFFPDGEKTIAIAENKAKENVRNHAQKRAAL